MIKSTQRLTLVSVLALTGFGSGAAWAQFEGLDLTDSAPAPKKTDKPAAKKPEPKKAPPVESAPAAAAPAEKSLELDLSSTADVKAVLVLPPIVRVTSSTGGFSGFDTKKVSEKFDLQAHKRLVGSFEKQLDGKVIPAELAQGVISKEGITPASVRTAAGMVRLARATNVAFMVVSELNKSGALVSNIYDATGKQQGQPSFVNNAAGISQKHADDMAAYVSRELVNVSKAAAIAAAAAVAASTPAKEPQAVLPPPEDDVAEPVTEFATVTKRSFFDADASRTRLAVTVGPGAVMRVLEVSGERASSLAELRNGGLVGLGVYAQISPLQFIEAAAGKKWADLEVEVHWRRAFAKANGVEGAVEGQVCSVTDDDLQVRGTYRYKLGDGDYMPSVGVGGGFSQERTLVACDLPVVSTEYRGADAQLRIRQPLYKNFVSLDLAVGPRFLFGGASATPGFSIGGEAWVEFKPITYLFGRAGGRVSRLQVSDGASLAVVDTRMFFALEVGAFF